MIDMPKFVNGLHDYLGRALQPLAKRVQALEATISEIESKGVRYRGVFQRSEDYQRGDLVTHHGSMWHANLDTREQPGVSADWQLAVKAGRDSK